MVVCLVIGDSHIPRRAKEIPFEINEKLTELSEKELFDYTFFTGDLIKCPELIDFLKLRTRNEISIVIGNMDYYGGNREAPIFQKLEVFFHDNSQITMGLTHGAQIKPRGEHLQLESLAINKDFNILISGHTHYEEVFLTRKGALLLNPGSVTGAWSFVSSSIPSFIVVSIEELSKQIIVNLFQLNKGTKEINHSLSYFMYRNNKIHYKM